MLENCLHSSTMLTGGQLVVPFRVRPLSSTRIKLLASPTCPIQCRINRWGDKFGIWSRNGSSSVKPIAERCFPPLRHRMCVYCL